MTKKEKVNGLVRKIKQPKTIRPLIVGDEMLHTGTWDWPLKAKKKK